MSQARGLPPAPIVFPGDEPFWDAARQGQLLAKHCQSCDRLHYYPRARCPFCGSDQTVWQALSGRASIYSYTIVERSPRPTAPAIVETEEGLRLSTAVIDADVHALRIGDAVSLRFLPAADGTPLPAFTTPQADRARDYSKAALQALDTGSTADPDSVKQVAVIGGGNMGVGISLAMLTGGFDVLLVDTTEEAVATALGRVRETLAQDVSRGRLREPDVAERLGRLATSTDVASIAQADLVIEAVWEDMVLKQELFARIDAHAKPGAVLASNTSTLDIGAIGAATTRPQSVVGMHFFNPAQVMRLLEVVRSPATSEATLAIVKAVARRIHKVPVVVGICDGFVGNRLMIAREREASRLLLDGALPHQIDRVLREFGLPMGTFELQDMAGGIALTYRARQRSGQQDWLIEQLFERGWTGLRAGRGYYRYEPGKRRPLVDPEVTALIEAASRQQGIERRCIGDDEIRDRLILPMINEGAKLVSEGIVERASDIDLVWQYGYGWPDWKGGPVYHADSLGLDNVVARLTALRGLHGDVFKPAELLIRLAGSGERLSNQTA